MTPTFKNLLEAQAYFHSEEVCREHLEQSRWNGNPVCPYCGVDKTPYKLKGGKKYRCSDKDCRRTFTATIGTIFEDTKIPLQKWYLAIYIASAHKKGISSLQLGRDIGVTQKTAWFLLHRIREMLNDKAPVLLKGKVEVDETYVGGKEKNKHQSAHAKAKRLEKAGGKLGRGTQSSDTKSVVVGLLERDGSVINFVVPKADEENLLPLIEQNVEKGSTMLTDGLNMYCGVVALGYNHEAVNHSAGEYVRGDSHTGTIDGYWSLLKRGIVGIYHNVSPKHLHRYCDEFAYRYNTRGQKDSERFHHSLARVDGKRLTYKRLVNKEGNAQAILK